MNKLICCAVIATLVAGCATPHRRQARSPMERKIEKMFQAADTDGDEWLTPAELDAGFPWLAGKFSEVDTDHNGKVSEAEVGSYIELQALQPPPSKPK